jgi:hypothetical protein
MTPDGALILTDAFKASLARAGCTFPETRARAFDAAPPLNPEGRVRWPNGSTALDAERNERAEYYNALQEMYDQIRRSGQAASTAEIRALHSVMFPARDTQKHAAESAERGRIANEQFQSFRRTRGLDSLTDGECRRIFELEQAYADVRAEGLRNRRPRHSTARRCWG